jgi:hypothetical protein
VSGWHAGDFQVCIVFREAREVERQFAAHDEFIENSRPTVVPIGVARRKRHFE